MCGSGTLSTPGTVREMLGLHSYDIVEINPTQHPDHLVHCVYGMYTVNVYAHHDQIPMYILLSIFSCLCLIFLTVWYPLPLTTARGWDLLGR